MDPYWPHMTSGLKGWQQFSHCRCFPGFAVCWYKALFGQNYKTSLKKPAMIYLQAWGLQHKLWLSCSSLPATVVSFKLATCRGYSVFTSETRKFKMILYPLISTELTRGQGCVGGGGSCKADSECCSKKCQRISFNNYRCEFGNGCVSGGGSCDADSECCSKRCQRITPNSYRCEKGNGCVSGGGSCDADSECCSKKCTHITSNTNRCEFGNGCVNGGGSCTADSDCCSNRCERISFNTYRCERAGRGLGKMDSNNLWMSWWQLILLLRTVLYIVPQYVLYCKSEPVT